MDRAQCAVICLAFGAAVTAGPALAKDGATHVSPWDRVLLVPALWPQHMVGLPPAVPLPNRAGPNRAQFFPSIQLVPSLTFQKSKSGRQAVEMGSFNALFETSRSKTAQLDGLSYFARPRVASLQARAALQYDMAGSDTLALAASLSHERRRPAIMISQRRQVSSNDRSFSLGWNHDDKFQLAFSAYDVRPSRKSGSATRLVELASGAPRASTGVALSLSLSPTGNRDEFSLGFDVRQQRAEWQETPTFGGRAGETIGALSARIGF